MTNNRVVQRAERIGNRYNTRDFCPSPEISTLFYIIQDNFSFLIKCSENENLSGHDLLKVKNSVKMIEDSVNEILTKPRFKKYARRHKNFLERILKEKNSVYKEIEDKNFAGKSLEIGVAKKLITEMKACETVIDNDYRFLKASIKSESIAAIQDVHFEGDAYRLLNQLRNVNDIHKTISSLSTEKQFEQELDELKADATSEYDAISAVVVRDYDKLKVMESKLQQERPEFKNYYPIIKDEIDDELEKL